MASEFLPVDRDQLLLMPPSVDEWVPDDDPVRFVVEVVEVLDLSSFVALHPLGGVGRRAYHPAMMVGLLLWAYANGVFSSRQIERRCVTDVSFRFVAANQVPDHGTIARFRASRAAELKALHAQVLAMCADVGLVSLGLVALDGTKVAANASKDANRTRVWLEEQIGSWFDEAAAADAADDEVFGDDRGDGVPEDLRRREERRSRIREAAKRAAEREEAKRRRPPKSDKAERGPVANTTDPASGLMPVRGGGFVQGYNAQAVANRGGVVLATRVVGTPVDAPQFVPMLELVHDNLAAAGIEEPVGTVVADAGYWSEANAAADVAAADVLIATDQSDAKLVANLNQGLPEAPPDPGPDPGGVRYQQRLETMQRWETGEIDYRQAATEVGVSVPRVYELRAAYRDRGPKALAPKHAAPGQARPVRKGPTTAQHAKHAMRLKLNSEQGRDTYRQRAPTIEGVFGNTKHNQGFRRFSRRGQPAVDAEWGLVHIVGNINKTRRALETLCWILAGRPLAGTG
jgi:transposase